MEKNLKNKTDDTFVNIYTLAHPDTNEVFYIGKTSMELSRRLSCHWTQKSDSLGKRMKDKMNELKQANKKPVIELIEICHWQEGKRLEEYWTQQFSSWGFILSNYRFNYNKSFISEWERKRQRDLRMKAVEKREWLMVRYLYQKDDCANIAKVADCTDERIRQIIYNLIHTDQKKVPIWIKEKVIDYFMVKAENILNIYLNDNENDKINER